MSRQPGHPWNRDRTEAQREKPVQREAVETRWSTRSALRELDAVDSLDDLSAAKGSSRERWR